MVHDSIYDTLRDKLVIAAKQLVAGDPKVESTFIGPMISESEAERLETWIKSAIDAGGHLLWRWSAAGCHARSDPAGASAQR